MPTLFDKIINHFNKRGIQFTDRYMPYFICSVGCHILNLWNKSPHVGARGFARLGGVVQDLRLHVLMIAPPGFSKSLYIESFLNPYTGIMPTSLSAMPSTCTHAGLVGAVDRRGTMQGVFERDAHRIIGFDEFHALDVSGKQEHSTEMMDSLLRLLDSGRYSRPMRNGVLEYDTYSTLWGGVQQVRMGLESGIERRLLFIFFSPNKREREYVFDAWCDSHDIVFDIGGFEEIRNDILDLYQDSLNNLRTVVLPDNFREIMKDITDGHNHAETVKRMMYGYTLMNGYAGDDELVVKVDNRLKDMMTRVIYFKSLMALDPMYAVVKGILEGNGMEMSMTSLCKEIARDCHVRITTVRKSVENMVRDGFLYADKRFVPHCKKPVVYMGPTDDLLEIGFT